MVSSTVPSVVSGDVFRANVVVVTADDNGTEDRVVVVTARVSPPAPLSVVAGAGTVEVGES